MYKKQISKMMFSFMCLLIFLQYVTPIVVLATETKEPVQLAQLKVTNQDPETLEAVLDLQINNTDQSQTQTLTFNEGATIQSIQAVNSAESTNVDYVANKNQIEMKVDPHASPTLELKLTFAAKDLEAATELTVQSNQQHLNAELPTTEVSTSETTTETSSSELVESSTTDTTDSAQKESDQSTEITTESSKPTTSTTPNTVAQEDPAAEKIQNTTKTLSADPQDIRVLLAQAGITPATLIDNAKIEYFDENGKLYPDQMNVPIDAHVHVSYKWSIPEDILSQLKAGDYFDFKLPNGVTIQPGSGKLGDYGTYTIAQDGTVHFVFNQKVETDHDIKGTFDYDAKFVKTTEPGEITIDTPTEENFPPSTIHIRPKYDQAIDKAGHFDKTPNPNEVIWEININRPLNTMRNATLTDPMPEGTTFKTVAVYPETVDREGKITSVDKEHPLVKGKDYTVNAAGTVTFINSYAETNQAFQVVYTAKINEDKKPDKGGSVKFTNKATLDDGTSKTDASATVAAEYKAPITKKGPTPTGQNQEYKWSIQYNYNEKKRPAGATVTDTMSEELRLVDNSTKLYRITFDKNGKEVQGALLKAGEDYELIQEPSNPQKFAIKFLKDIDYAVRIDYLTKVTGYVDDPTKISNSVTTDTDDHSSSGGTAEQQGIVKNFDGAIDYDKREIPWKIDINNAGYWMENWELEDTFSEGLTLVNGSFQLIDRSDNNRVLNSSEYVFTQTTTGFNLSFKDPLAKGTDHKYQIKYKTVFDTSAIDPGNGHESDIKFKNKASMTWKDKSGGTHSNSSEKPFDPKPAFKYNGQKSGEYNAMTKKITWTVAVNYNQQTLRNSTIVDPISTPQNYVAGSGKLYEATINKDGSYTLGDKVAGEIVEPTKDNPKIEVKLPAGSTKAYVFVFDTSLMGEIINQKEYKNSATFTNDGVSHDLAASVTPAHTGELVAKDGEQDPSDSSYVKWRVTVNGSQSTMKDVEVTDEPSANQYVAADDVKVYGTIVDKAGNITKDPNTVLIEGTDYQLDIQTNNETGAQIITVKFLKQIETSYVIEYRALITSDKAQDEVTNHAHIKGINEKTYTDDVEKNVVVINHSGTAEGSKGSVLFQKQNEAGEKLVNAHLQLWTINKDGQKDKLVREGDTDAKGELKLGNLRVTDYLLIETKAPAGYTISDELANGKKITIKKDTETTTFAPQKIINQPTKVILHKSGETVDASGQRQKNPLAGAVFKVLDSKGKVISGYERLVSDNTGTVTIEKLAPGNYQIVEIEAPTDYILDNKVIEFEVKQQENGIIPVIDLGTKINYQGSAKLIKKDPKGNALAGAEFKVI
ncbi:collagen binding domain-containing protein, partial [Enterococcus viikkiensis]|uniref:collagen binding domain-containing protein n=1 Tax=Enterococcus viikkiensis TaxID=930854 RepID=UPI003F8E0C39